MNDGAAVPAPPARAKPAPLWPALLVCLSLFAALPIPYVMHYFIVLGVIVGACCGSFAGVCLCRLPQGRSIVRPGSSCDSCGTLLGWRENLPIVSYAVQRGRCRHCGAAITARALVVEVVGGAIGGLLALLFTV